MLVVGSRREEGGGRREGRREEGGGRREEGGGRREEGGYKLVRGCGCGRACSHLLEIK